MITLSPGARADEALKAFQTISAELEKVRPLNYRSAMFTNWKKIVQVALSRFLGEEHPATTQFAGLIFHGPMPKSPMDPPVSQKDAEAYAAAMDATTVLMKELVSELAPAAAPAAKPVIPEPPAIAPARPAGV